MNTLAEIQAAVEALPHEQKEELIRFLAERLGPRIQSRPSARLVKGPNGVLLLEAPPDAPPMTTEAVKQMLADFP